MTRKEYMRLYRLKNRSKLTAQRRAWLTPEKQAAIESIKDTYQFDGLPLPAPVLADAKAHAEFQAELEAVWNAKTWTPTVGELVRLKSGGPVMVVEYVKEDEADVVWINSIGDMRRPRVAIATLTPAKEEQP